MNKQQVIDILEAYKPSGNMKWWQAGSGVIKNEYVTHWMPLPKLPKIE